MLLTKKIAGFFFSFLYGRHSLRLKWLKLILPDGQQWFSDESANIVLLWVRICCPENTNSLCKTVENCTGYLFVCAEYVKKYCLTLRLMAWEPHLSKNGSKNGINSKELLFWMVPNLAIISFLSFLWICLIVFTAVYHSKVVNVHSFLINKVWMFWDVQMRRTAKGCPEMLYLMEWIGTYYVV